jgi:hypothetical protein
MLILFVFLKFCLCKFWRSGSMPLPGPFPEKSHWWLGRFLVVASVVQIFLGLVEGEAVLGFGVWVYGIFAAWYGLLVCVFAAGVALMQRQLKQKQGGKPRDRIRIEDQPKVTKNSDTGLMKRTLNLKDDNEEDGIVTAIIAT